MRQALGLAIRGIQVIPVGGQFQIRVVLQNPVQLVQEVVAVLRVIFPGILTVQNHRNHRIGVVAIILRNILHVMYQVTHGIPGVPVGIGKADQVRQPVITEKHGQRLFSEPEWPVDTAAAIAGTFATGQFHAVVDH